MLIHRRLIEVQTCKVFIMWWHKTSLQQTNSRCAWWSIFRCSIFNFRSCAFYISQFWLLFTIKYKRMDLGKHAFYSTIQYILACYTWKMKTKSWFHLMFFAYFQMVWFFLDNPVYKIIYEKLLQIVFTIH